MSGLAKYLAYCGKNVAGSDICDSIYTRELTALGINVETGILRQSVQSYDAVVYTDAIREDDIQLSEAFALNKTVITRGKLLAEISKNFQNVIAVSGCHGKTTCTAMLAHIFAAANKKFGAHIGGRDKTFKNAYFCGDEFLLTEACEYKKNFLYLSPDIAIILNGDADHLECYGSVENLRSAYLNFAGSAKTAVTLYGDFQTDGLTFGYDENADYHAKKITSIGGAYCFTAYEGDNVLGKICLKVYGKHNVLNALAAIAAARCTGIPFALIKKGLESFEGVERRFESLGKINGAEFIADYAHHPNEIKATVRAAKKITQGRLFVVFQPHTYSRTKNLFKEFVRVLSGMEKLLIFRTFAAREYYDDAGSALTLSQAVKKSRYGDDVRDIADFILSAKEGDTVLFLGAGDIYEIAQSIVRNLSPRP